MAGISRCTYAVFLDAGKTSVRLHLLRGNTTEFWEGPYPQVIWHRDLLDNWLAEEMLSEPYPVGSVPGGVITFRGQCAIGDGVTNDTTAVNSAMALASSTGQELDGEGIGNYTYAVSGEIVLPSNLKMYDAGFKQLNTSGALRTLTCTNGNMLDLRRIKVDRGSTENTGGSAPNYYLNSAWGIRINGGTNHHLEDLEIVGDGSGTGIRLTNLDSTSTIIRPRCTDVIVAIPSTPWQDTDDMFQGIWLENCTDVDALEPYVYNFRTRNGTDLSHFNNRGLVMSDCVRCRYMKDGGARHLATDLTDQGIDLTGSGGNIECSIVNLIVRRSQTNGIKFANSAVQCFADNCDIDRAGYHGFICSGPSEVGLPNKTEFCEFRNGIIRDGGWSGAWNARGRLPDNIRFERQTIDQNYPRGCVVRDSTSVAGSNMTGGHKTDNTIGANPANTLVNITYQ